MRYVIYGAGAVGGTIGARLFESHQDVVLLARGPHLDALQKQGLRLDSPETSTTLAIPAVGGPDEIEWRDDDVVMLTMKTQDTGPALDALAAVAPPSVSVVCAQNGVENERLAARHFADVYAICVMLPATHLEPGVVQSNGAPLSGILDVGRFPGGSDVVAAQMAGDLSASRFSSRPDPLVMRSKYAKLLMNLGNALEAACGPIGRGSDLYRRAREEGEACLRAAGIDFASIEEDRARRGDLMRIQPVAGTRRGGGSSWQSLARGSGTIESDYLNGEIVLLGRLHGVPTPVNEMLQRVANELACAGAPPASLTEADLEARLAAV